MKMSVTQQNLRFTALFRKPGLALASALMCFVNAPLYAEDIEIYTAVSAPGVSTAEKNPNILFIMDNSTSMSNTEPVYEGLLSELNPGPPNTCNLPTVNAQAPYDPTVDYGYDGNAADDSYIYIYDGGSYRNRVVRPNQNSCKAVLDRFASNPTFPSFVTRIAQWRENSVGSGRWRWYTDFGQYVNSTDNRYKMECDSDAGVHGRTDTSTNKYARNFNDLRTRTNSNSRYRFYSSNGRSPFASNRVTLRLGNYHDYLENRAGRISPPCTPPPVYGNIPQYQNLPEVDSLTDNDACGGTGSDDGRGGNNVFPNPWDDDRFVLKGTEQVYICKSRFDIMKAAMEDLIDNLSETNVGLMAFNKNQASTASVGSDNGGTVINAVEDIDGVGAKAKFKNSINSMVYGFNTPISETFYEGVLYMRGEQRYNGYIGQSIQNGLPTPQTLPNTDSNALGSGNKYIGPIKTQCQANSIVILSDGAPTSDDDMDGVIEGTTGSFGGAVSCSGNCGDEIARQIARVDNDTSTPNIDRINTYTIGFNTGSATNTENTYLLGIADAGRPADAAAGSGFFRADNFTQLLTALQTIVQETVNVEADVFTAPAVTVNAFNRLQNREDIYYALFKPEGNPRWPGNVKKYKVNAQAKIVDALGNEAISTEGFFKDTAKSFWSANADGPNVQQGGAGEKIVYPRKLFGQVNNSVEFLSAANATDAVVQFIKMTSRNTAGNVDIGYIPGQLNPNVPTSLVTAITSLLTSISGTAGLLQLEPNEISVAAWALGLDIDDERETGLANASNQYLGDSQHSTPYVLSFGPNITNAQDTIFYTTNQGMLQAIDGDTGNELWAYVPDEDLFGNLGDYYNRAGTGKIYGLDGEIAFLVDRNPTTQAVTKAQLFFGQRRGGNKIFAVDVSNARSTTATTPIQRLWTIEGGSGDYARLGDTWAEPVVSRAEICDAAGVCGQRDVLFVSGGYDNSYDDANRAVASASGSVLGNALYMIDAQNGNLLWMAGSTVVDSDRDLVIPEMTHSIPAKPTVLDVDKNGAADTVFLTDISGQIFRIDFKGSQIDTDDISIDNNQTETGTFDGNSVSYKNVTGGRIANLAETNVNRRFYNPVDVSLLPAEADSSGVIVAKARYSLSTGSGYRAHPLDAEAFGNRLYVIYDENVTSPLYDEEVSETADADTLGEAVYTYADLANSPREIQAGDLSSTFVATGNGFYFNLSNAGEKLLSPTVISDFQILAVSYIPADFNAVNLSDKCDAGLGTSVAYAFDLRTGSVVTQPLEKPGLAASPVVIFILETVTVTLADGTTVEEEYLRPVVIIGTEPFKGETFNLTDLKIGKADKKVWWETNRAGR